MTCIVCLNIACLALNPHTQSKANFGQGAQLASSAPTYVANVHASVLSLIPVSSPYVISMSTLSFSRGLMVIKPFHGQTVFSRPNLQTAFGLFFVTKWPSRF